MRRRAHVFSHVSADAWARRAYEPKEDVSRSRLARLCPPYAALQSDRNPAEPAAPAHRFFFDNVFHARIFNSRGPPAIDKPVHQPDQQKREHAGKYDVREKMTATGHAQEPDGHSKCQCGPIGRGPPGGRRQRSRCQRPKGPGWLARDKRAILVAGAARIPPGKKRFVAAELHYENGARTTRVVLENRIRDQAWSKRQRCDHQQCGASRHKHGPVRQEELKRQGHEGRRNDQSNGQRGSATQPHTQWPVQPPACFGVIKNGRHPEIEFGKESEDDPNQNRNRKRNQRALTIHAGLFPKTCSQRPASRTRRSIPPLSNRRSRPQSLPQGRLSDRQKVSGFGQTPSWSSRPRSTKPR